jgi:hypothetical protein
VNKIGVSASSGRVSGKQSAGTIATSLTTVRMNAAAMIVADSMATTTDEQNLMSFQS